MKRTGPTNVKLQSIIADLKLLSYKEKVGVWLRVAEDLEKPTRQRRVVNLSHLNLFANDKEMLLVCGKVLGTGELENKCTIAAWQFSDQAKEKITNAKGSCLTIPEVMKKNPKGENIRIIG